MATIIAISVAILIIVIIVLKPVAGVWLLLAGLFCMPTYFATWDFFGFGLRIYFLDIVLLPLFTLSILPLFTLAIISGRFRFGDKNILKWPFFIWILFGLFSVVYCSIFFNYPANQIFGFFRRFFFYPFVSYYTILYYFRSDHKLQLKKKMPTIFSLIVISIFLLAMTRYMLGISFVGQRFVGTGSYDFEMDFRALSHIESLALLLGLFFFLYRLISKRVSVFSWSGAMVFLALTGVTMSGFRVILVTLIVGIILFLIFYRLSRHADGTAYRSGSLLKIGALGVLFIMLFSTLLPSIYTKQKEMVIGKIIDTSSGTPIVMGIGWRVALWGHNFREFSKSPVLGRGLGYKSLWYMPGAEFQRMNDTHNVFLSLVVRLGVVGLVLFGWLHLRFIRHALKLIVKGQDVPLIIPLFLFYLLMFFVGLFQPGPFGTHGAAMLAVTMGLIISVGRDTDQPDIIGAAVVGTAHAAGPDTGTS